MRGDPRARRRAGEACTRRGRQAFDGRAAFGPRALAAAQSRPACQRRRGDQPDDLALGRRPAADARRAVRSLRPGPRRRAGSARRASARGGEVTRRVGDVGACARLVEGVGHVADRQRQRHRHGRQRRPRDRHHPFAADPARLADRCGSDRISRPRPAAVDGATERAAAGTSRPPSTTRCGSKRQTSAGGMRCPHRTAPPLSVSAREHVPAQRTELPGFGGD